LGGNNLQKIESAVLSQTQRIAKFLRNKAVENEYDELSFTCNLKPINRFSWKLQFLQEGSNCLTLSVELFSVEVNFLKCYLGLPSSCKCHVKGSVLLHWLKEACYLSNIAMIHLTDKSYHELVYEGESFDMNLRAYKIARMGKSYYEQQDFIELGEDWDELGREFINESRLGTYSHEFPEFSDMTVQDAFLGPLSFSSIVHDRNLMKNVHDLLEKLNTLYPGQPSTVVWFNNHIIQPYSISDKKNAYKQIMTETANVIKKAIPKNTTFDDPEIE
jgi:hypothetical protein